MLTVWCIEQHKAMFLDISEGKSGGKQKLNDLSNRKVQSVSSIQSAHNLDMRNVSMSIRRVVQLGSYG